MSLIVSYLGEKSIDHLAGGIFGRILEKRSLVRAEEFYNQLTSTVNQSDDQQLALLLQSIDGDPDRADILFSAYRDAILAKSRILGPRYIAWRTAEILNKEKPPSQAQRDSFTAAEFLDDDELVEFSKFILDSESSPSPNHPDRKRVELASHSIDSNASFDEELSNQVDINDFAGPWAQRCVSLGLFHQYSTTVSRAYEEDGERHIDAPGTLTKTTFYLEFGVASELLASGLRKVAIGTKFYW